MSIKNSSLVVQCLGLAMLAGCAEDVDVEAEAEGELATVEQAVQSCNTNAGKWTHLANLAVAVAEEMGELNTSEQFAIGSNMYGERVVLSTYGQSVCQARGGCPMVEDLLGLQDLENNTYVDQSIFNTIDYRISLVNMYRQQVMQIAQLVANRRFDLAPEDHSLTFLGEDGTATCGTPWYSFQVKRDFHFGWSSTGTIADMTCTSITEPSDPDGWTNNYLCSERNVGLKWSSSGTVSGMTCLNVNEPSDPNGWSDNYLCAPEAWGLAFSSTGANAGQECIQWTEGSDPDSWDDNYLCWDSTANLLHPNTLCQEFWMYGGAVACGGSNPYIDFVVSGDNTKFKIDPTDYNSSGINTGSTGFCYTNLPLVSTKNMTGDCCLAPGGYGVLKKSSSKAYTYYCKNW